MFRSPLRAEFCCYVNSCSSNRVRYDAYLSLEDVTLLEDKLDDFLLLVGAKLAVELTVRGAIKDTGGSLPIGVLVSVGHGGVSRVMFVRTCG